MKRISIVTIVLLLVMTSMATGRVHYYDSWYRRVRWSFHAHGLVPGDLRYSPYAHKYGHSGLVPYWVRYSPYAHTYKHPSGLVNDYSCSTSSVYYCPSDVIYRGSCRANSQRSRADENSCGSSAGTKRTRDYVARIKAQREKNRRLAQLRKEERRANSSAGKQTIIAYLKGNDIDFRMSRQMSIEGDILSADFVIGDGHMVISYWDPDAIKALNQQAEYRLLRYQNYVNSWKNFCAEYQQAGGKILQIVSTDREDVLAKLTSFDLLSESQTTYAVAHPKP